MRLVYIIPPNASNQVNKIFYDFERKLYWRRSGFLNVEVATPRGVMSCV